MTLSLNTNVAASKAAFHLAKNQENLNKSLERLSSGKRINSASDDAGGLAVAMKMEHEISKLKGASSSLANGISLLQVQDSVFENLTAIVQRLGEVKAQSLDVLQTGATNYDDEVVQLSAQLASIATADANKFNGIDVVIGANLSITVGDSTIEISREADQATFRTAAVTSTTGTNDFTTGITQASDITETQITEVLGKLATLRAANGAKVNEITYAQDNVNNQITNLQAAFGRIMDVDVAEESANLARQQILVQASASMVAQANSVNNAALLLLQ